jgi:hypothetical protein
MPAGSGSAQFDAQTLELAMIRVFGPDFRDKAIAGPLGVFRLADAFEECGLVDPRASAPSSGGYGLFQFVSASSADGGLGRRRTSA